MKQHAFLPFTYESEDWQDNYIIRYNLVIFNENFGVIPADLLLEWIIVDTDKARVEYWYDDEDKAISLQSFRAIAKGDHVVVNLDCSNKEDRGII